MSNRRFKRILNEIKELQNSSELFDENGIHFHYEDDKMDKLYLMIMGPKDSPYELGFYFFELEYPENYPMTPPKVTYQTQGLLPLYSKKKSALTYFQVRFNPNLYTNGKVCLSMLNTWAGPGWVPTNTVTNILVAIQALVLNDEPMRNEPGFEHSSEHDIRSYNLIIQYANLKVAILDQIKLKNLGKFECFREKIISLFLDNYSKISNLIDQFQPIDKDIIQSPAYGMTLQLDYENLKNYSKIMYYKLLLENQITSNEKNNNNVEINNAIENSSKK